MLTQRFLLPFQLPKTSRVSALISSAEDETRADVPTGSIDELPKAPPCFARYKMIVRVSIYFGGVTTAGVLFIFWMPSAEFHALRSI